MPRVRPILQHLIDPRLEKATRFVNGEIAQRAIRHSVYLERLKTHEVEQIIALLNDDVIPDVLDQLYRKLPKLEGGGYAISPRRRKRLRELAKSLKSIMSVGMRDARVRLNGQLSEIALSEAKWQAAIMQQTVPVEIDFATPSLPTLRSIVTSRPMEGELLSKWASQQATSTVDRVMREVEKGLVQGDGTSKIVRRIKGTRKAGYADGVLETSRREVEALVRTSVSHVTNHAREETYRENSDVVDKVQFVATLDSRTSDICMNLDGQTFPIGGGPRPPMHFNCRSTCVPVLKSWKQLGIPLKEAPPGTRASMSGQVPAKTTFGTWLKGQPSDVQKDVLGPKRAALFRQGKVRFDRFFNDRGKRLTLKELEKLEGVSVK